MSGVRTIALISLALAALDVSAANSKDEMGSNTFTRQSLGPLTFDGRSVYTQQRAPESKAVKPCTLYTCARDIEPVHRLGQP
jgi:hypothetical protein